MKPTRLLLRLAAPIAVCALVTLGPPWADGRRCEGAEALPGPGDPRGLLDWRGLARPPQGPCRVAADPTGQKKLPKVGNTYELLKLDGPGVLDHFWARHGQRANLAIEVDGKTLWKGPLDQAFRDAQRKKTGVGPFPRPVSFSAANMQHILAPIGFKRQLRLTCDKPKLPHYIAFRTFAARTKVVPAASRGPYADTLKLVGQMWDRPGYEFQPSISEAARKVASDFTVPPGGRATALRAAGSGEVVGMTFHMSPALTGTLRHVLVEFTYDGAKQPALRMPITDLVGVPHPWPNGRWDRSHGDLAAGMRWPWTVDRPRTYYPEMTFWFNLPVPFADGLRVDLINRSKDHQFTGTVRATVNPLSRSEAQTAGRLCGTRRLVDLARTDGFQDLIEFPGRGKIVGLGLFMTGGAARPPASQNGTVALTLDGGDRIAGPGLLPLWYGGAYTAPVTGMPIWSHPKLQAKFAGCMRHFLTDPLPFRRTATLSYSLGKDPAGAPDKALAIALWYRFERTPYAAPALAEHAEPLPDSVYAQRPMRFGRGKDRKTARVVWAMEAEDMVPMAVAHEAILDVADDPDHNYHPSQGKYLRAVAERIGGRVDCTVPLPASRYVAVGTVSLWGTVRGTYEMDLLTVQEAKGPPVLPQSKLAGYGDRELWSLRLRARVLMSKGMWHRRDGTPHHPIPIRNPNPDGKGILRFLCVDSPGGAANILALDQVQLDAPPAAEPGLHEFESSSQAAMLETRGGLEAYLPKYGNFNWSGWGAMKLESVKGGEARIQVMAFTGPAQPKVLKLRGTLAPAKGQWQVQVVGASEPVSLAAGKDDKAVVEWTVPLTGLKLPGPITLQFTCTEQAEREKRKVLTPLARIALDAWSVE